MTVYTLNVFRRGCLETREKSNLFFLSIFPAFFLIFFFIVRIEKNEEISVLIINLKSIKPEVSQKAEKRLVEMGGAAVEPLRKAYDKEVIAIKYYDTVKAFRNVFCKKKSKTPPELVGEILQGVIPRAKSNGGKDKKRGSTRKTARHLIVYNIVRLKNTLSQLGDRNAVDQGVVTSVLECVGYSDKTDYPMIQEQIEFFKSAGRSSIHPLMEQQRGTDVYSLKSEIISLFLLEAVDEKSVDILLYYLKDKDEKVRAPSVSI